MIELVELQEHLTLENYASVAHLAPAVRDLQSAAAKLVPKLDGRTLWMVNSTAVGGGVAEMLPRVVVMLNQLGVSAKWAVIHSDQPEFFRITKNIHNLIHGAGDPEITEEDRACYEAVNRRNAEDLAGMVAEDDILAVHDPQPMAAGALVKEATGAATIWRCHIGLDRTSRETRAAWKFLERYAAGYDHAIFSAPEYVPPFLAGRASIIHPGIDPLGHKNRHLSPVRITGVLCDAGLAIPHSPVVTPPFANPAKRLRPDGSFGSATEPDEIGFLFRPIVTQISRWDRLKGWRPLLEGFARMKERLRQGLPHLDTRSRHRLEITRLVLAGPEAASVDDDPEGREVLDELCELYKQLRPELQSDIALLCLPMKSRKENALMVNALQSCSSLVVQNSIEEGFGLTATEAMYKRLPVLATRACGLRQQIRHGTDGHLLNDPEDREEIAEALITLLSDQKLRESYSRNAQRRAHDDFLVFTQVRRWLEVLAEKIPAARSRSASRTVVGV